MSKIGITNVKPVADLRFQVKHKRIDYKPQDDLTVMELSTIMLIFLFAGREPYDITEHSDFDKVKRHFEVSEL